MKRGGNSWALNFLLGLALVVVLCEEVRMAHGANLSPGQCKEERRLIINTCKPVVFGQSPSSACCVRVRVTHFECVCPVVDAKLAALITLNRATQILRACGRAVPRRFKCGSIYFP